GWHGEVSSRTNTRRPARRHRLDSRIEAHAFGTMLIGVTKGRILPAAERMKGERHRDGNVNAHHSDLNSPDELTRCIAFTGKDCDAVSVFVIAGESQGFLEIICPDDRQYRAKYFFPINPHLRRHPIEQG